MNHFLRGVAQATSEAFDLPEPILEIGSFQVEGQEDISNLRPLFPKKKYIGVDRRSGPGVDFVADVEDLPYPDSSIGTVIAMSTFEHVPRFWRGFEEIHRVLRADGALLISCPFYFRIHNQPSDYWRFTPEAIDLLLERFPTRILGWQGAKKRPLNVWAVAFTEQWPALAAEQLTHYQELLARYAHEPLSWLTQWRYRLARWICGRRPLSPFLDQACWEIVCRTQTPRPARRRRPAEPMRPHKPR